MQTELNPFMQEATEALIGNLLASEAFSHYHQAQNRLNYDAEAQAVLNQLAQMQAYLRKQQENGNIRQTEVSTLRDLQGQVQRNRTITAYAQSQQEAVNFLREINAEISQLLGLDFATFANHATC